MLFPAAKVSIISGTSKHLGKNFGSVRKLRCRINLWLVYKYCTFRYNKTTATTIERIVVADPHKKV